MDQLGVQQKSPKASKSKKNPIKVVYISNPKMVKASASEFRALVQELTGQDRPSPTSSPSKEMWDPPIRGRQPELFDRPQVPANNMETWDHMSMMLNQETLNFDSHFEYLNDLLSASHHLGGPCS
ncbi:hypothetical protein AMTRI_Chr01g127690 [Amborella trichopoda]|uniref:VQ domain-containing protein n=1 Tax=Amborella trichopoda TaxID=13333 RepID=W1NT48_AMBTC|nr:hypothetical protein AMTR_s00095p00067480 [Amborella trichopoda]